MEWEEIAGITDYIVTLKSSNGTELSSEILQDTLEETFTGLQPGQDYYILIGLQCLGDILTLRQYTRKIDWIDWKGLYSQTG